MFNFSVDKDGKLVKGWFPQMYAARKILFAPDLFSRTTFKEMRSFELNKKLFAGENPPSFSASSLFGYSIDKVMDVVRKAMGNTGNVAGSSNIYDLLKRTYATLLNLYFHPEQK